MRGTLDYFYNIRGNSVDKSNGGVGIIPWTYEEARKYWTELSQAKQKNQDVEMNKYILPTREIHILPPQRDPMHRRRKLFTFLDEGESEE